MSLHAISHRFPVTAITHIQTNRQTWALTQNNGHDAVQGHSRSPILVPMEIQYATSY